jgi:hypothetical protein
MSAPTILNVIVCDLVSQEITGKFTCVGIYPAASIALPVIPGAVSLAFYMEVVGRKSGQLIGTYQIRCVGNPQALVTDTFSFVSATDVRMPLYTKSIHFVVSTPGEYVLEWFFDGHWSDVTKFTLVAR